MVNLQSLDMSQCAVSDLAPLGEMVNLRSLTIYGCRAVSELAPLGAMVNLQRLNIYGCSAVSDMAPLAGLVKLRSLNMYGCSAVSDLAPLGAMVKLRSLNLDGCIAVSDLTPLVCCKELRNSLRLGGQTIDASSLCNVISACSPQLHINVQDCVFPFAGFPWRDGGNAALLEALADPHIGERLYMRSCKIELAPGRTLDFEHHIADDQDFYYDDTTDDE
jgi:hypothetical protein